MKLSLTKLISLLANYQIYCKTFFAYKEDLIYIQAYIPKYSLDFFIYIPSSYDINVENYKKISNYRRGRCIFSSIFNTAKF